MQISRLRQFHEDEKVLAWWQQHTGGLLRWLTPRRRRAILATGAVWVCVKKPLQQFSMEQLPVANDGIGLATALLALLALLAVVWLCHRAAVAFSSLPLLVRQHPQLTLHSSYWVGLLILATTTPASGLWREVLGAVLLMFPFLIWRLGYLLFAGQYGRMTGTRFADHFLTIWPIYGGSNTPYGKGLAYLSRCEARNEEELARSQLAGIKLLVLCLLWIITLGALEGLFYGPGNALTARLGGHTLAIPRLSQLIEQSSAGGAVWMAWLSIYLELIYQVLRHAISGLKVIAMLRLFGFNVFRNTYKPLLAESVVEFWNRYYYYFKEVMANFFFLPTFAQLGSHLRNWPTLRLFAAVFAAAFVGNTYYHLIKLNEMMVEGRILDAVYGHRSRIFYCFLLALGIFVSMLREQRRGGRPPAAGRLRRLLRIAGVWTFFGLIFIWNVGSTASFGARVNFFLGLFGLA
jgi:hypothetical protein